MSTQPTDEEIDAVTLEVLGYAALDKNTNETARLIARAVLAKWGTPPAVAGEPVAWLRNTTDPQPHAVTNLKYRSAVDAKAGVEYIPVFAAPQPVAREPLSNKELVSLAKVGAIATNESGQVVLWPALYRNQMVDRFERGWREAEKYHGIKGGQHGTE